MRRANWGEQASYHGLDGHVERAGDIEGPVVDGNAVDGCLAIVHGGRIQ